jgi:hypothetical protein
METKQQAGRIVKVKFAEVKVGQQFRYGPRPYAVSRYVKVDSDLARDNMRDIYRFDLNEQVEVV